MPGKRIVLGMVALVVVSMVVGIYGPWAKAIVTADDSGEARIEGVDAFDGVPDFGSKVGWAGVPADGVEPAGSARELGYKPGEIIVKFKEPVASTLKRQLREGRPVGELRLSGSIDRLAAENKMRSIKPLIKNFDAGRERIENLLKKDKSLLSARERHLVNRLKRAPKGARVPDLGRIYKIALKEGQSAPEAVAEYNTDPDVEYAELNYVVSIFVTEPNDPNYDPEQWALNNTGLSHPLPGGNTSSGTSDCDIDAPEAWDIQTGSSEVVVAVLDTGVEYALYELSNNMWINQTELNGDPNVDDDENGYVDDIYGYDFCTYGQYRDSDPNDDQGHGTHCAGIIGADGNNGDDVAGVCWDVNIMALKFLGSTGSGWTDDALDAIYYAVSNGADIVSNSWGGIVYSQALEEACDYAHSQGVFLVAAAGNSNQMWPLYPAYYDNMMAVAATDHNDAKASFSNYGYWIDVAAPGKDILSLLCSNPSQRIRGFNWRNAYPNGDPNATMCILSGTSMACPHVAGLAALCLSEDPNLTVSDLWVLIKNGADDIGDTGYDDDFGAGRINAYTTLNYISSMPTPGKATDPLPSDSASNRSVNVHLSWEPNSWAASHDVYFGTSFSDVNDANSSSAQYKRNQAQNSYDPNTLDANSTYYWRIDEKNSSGIAKGDVWSFTTGPTGVIYVDVDATGGDDGTSWSDAFNDLQDALDKAFDGDEIWVAEGTYKPSDINDVNVSFEVREGVALYGGFDATESDVNDRDSDITANSTVLSGDIGTVDDDSDNSYHVVSIIGEHGNSSILDRLTVTDGNACVTPDFDAYGGGIFVFNSGVTLVDCNISDNHAQSSGGGLYIYDPNAPVTLTRCKFEDNSAVYGGAVGCSFVFDELSVSDCNFEDNFTHDNPDGWSGGSGGAMYLNNCWSVTIEDSNFNSNTATGLAPAIYASGNLTINDCTFLENESTHTAYTPAISCLGSMTASDSIFTRNTQTAMKVFPPYGFDGYPLVLENCTFSENSVGGLDFSNGPGIISNCLFRENDGYGIRFMAVNSSKAVDVCNCLFLKNDNPSTSAARAGGGICNYLSSPNITNCTFADNSAIYGGAVCNYSNQQSAPASPNITNSIFWDNTASTSGDQIYNGVADANCEADPNISYCDIEGSGGSDDWDEDLGSDLGGNIDVDPCFVDADANDFHLEANSPCIDAGDPNGDYSGQTDIDDEERVSNRTVDMGADEYDLTPDAHWWKFDEGSGAVAGDYIGDANGTLVGDANWTTGVFDDAVTLDGSGDYVSVSSLDSEYNSDDTFSVAGWFTTEQTTGKQTVVGQWLQVNPYMSVMSYFGWQVLVEDGDVKARFANGGSSVTDIAGPTGINDRWHHFALVYATSTDVTLYVDGTAFEGTGTYSSSGGVFRIGDGSFVPTGSPVMKGGPFNGDIDDVMLFERALSAEEVEQLWNAGQ